MFKILAVKNETKVMSKLGSITEESGENYIGFREEIVSYRKGYLRWA